MCELCIGPWRRSDGEINSRKVLVMHGGGRETPTAWRDVAVGDLVKV